jgi:hypothetical protein
VSKITSLESEPTNQHTAVINLASHLSATRKKLLGLHPCSVKEVPHINKQLSSFAFHLSATRKNPLGPATRPCSSIACSVRERDSTHCMQREGDSTRCMQQHCIACSVKEIPRIACSVKEIPRVACSSIACIQNTVHLPRIKAAIPIYHVR